MPISCKRLHDAIDDAAARRFAPADAAAQLDRFAGDDFRAGVADGDAVGVHDPGHRLLIGAQIGGGDIHARAEDRAKSLR